MLRIAFGLLCAAALLGGALALWYLRETAARPLHPALPPVHGALGAAGLVALVAALRRGLPPSTMGTAGFGPLAALLLAVVLALGLGFALRRGRPPGALVGTHAGLAIAGLVLLLAMLALG